MLMFNTAVPPGAAEPESIEKLTFWAEAIELAVNRSRTNRRDSRISEHTSGCLSARYYVSFSTRSVNPQIRGNAS
jgi:hypothetical protein